MHVHLKLGDLGSGVSVKLLQVRLSLLEIELGVFCALILLPVGGEKVEKQHVLHGMMNIKGPGERGVQGRTETKTEQRII